MDRREVHEHRLPVASFHARPRMLCGVRIDDKTVHFRIAVALHLQRLKHPEQLPALAPRYGCAHGAELPTGAPHPGHTATSAQLANDGSRFSTLATTASTWLGEPISATCSRVSSTKISLTLASDCARLSSRLPARIACGLF